MSAKYPHLGLPLEPTTLFLDSGSSGKGGSPWVANQVGANASVSPSFAFNVGISDTSLSLSGAGNGEVNYYSAVNNTNFGDPGNQFSFINQRVQGDFEFICRGTVGTVAKSQIGIAVREDLSLAPRGVTVFYSPLGTTGPVTTDPTPRDIVATVCRLSPGVKTGGQRSLMRATIPTQPNPQSRPYCWFRIVRIGNDIGTWWSRDGKVWIPIQAGPVLLATGPVFVGFYAAGADQSTLISTIFDNIYLGSPRQGWLTSWMGNNFSQASKGSNVPDPAFTVNPLEDGYVSTFLNAIYVGADGTTYASSVTDEFGQPQKIYKDGKIVRGIADNNTFGNNSGNEGSVTGNATQVFWYFANTNQVLQTNLNGYFIRAITFTNTIGAGGVTGMCCANAGTNELYVSDLTNNRILVVNTTTGAEISGRAFAFSQSRPGPITVDSRGNLWIVQEATTSPIAQKYVATLATGVYNYSAAGSYLSKSITDVSVPTDVAISPIADELWVTDNGQNQQIRIYQGLTTTPALNRTFGISGGIFAGSTPGITYDPASGGWKRFFGPIGIKFDSSGNVYVAGMSRGADIRKFDTSGNLVWQLHASLDTYGCPDFDPGTDGGDAYGAGLHHTLDLTQTAPGSEWSLKSNTWNPFSAFKNIDARINAWSAQPIFRTIGGVRFMFLTVTGQNINIYRFVGELAVPCGRLTTITGGPPGTTQLWIDTVGDGTEHAGDITTRASPAGQNGAVGAMAYDIDSNGDIWWLLSIRVVHLVFQGVNSLGSAVYNLSGGFDDTILWPAPFTFVNAGTAAALGLRYDRANDAMYIGGNTVAGSPQNVGYVQCGTTIARYSAWSSNKTTPAFTITLPTIASDGGNWYVQDPWIVSGGGQRPGFKSWHQADGYIFVWEEFGQIRIYDAVYGNFVGVIGPGGEVNCNTGWTDPSQARAYKRTTGEYLLTCETSGQMGMNFLYRWTPTRSVLSVPDAPTSLVTLSDNGSITLDWAGPRLTYLTGYNIYRAIGAGAESFLAAVSAPHYKDMSAPTGSAITYRVTAVNSVGEGARSNAAVGHSLIATASFVAIDTTTHGSWKGVYGVTGNFIMGDVNNLPASVMASFTGQLQQLIAPGTAAGDTRGLTQPGVGVTTIELFRRYSADFGAVIADLNFNDGATVKLAMYCVDWNAFGQTATLVVKNATTGATLDTRTTTTGLPAGNWVVWNLSGHVTITVTGGTIGEFDGIFTG